MNADFTPLYAQLEKLPDLAPDAVIPPDRVLSCGIQNHAYRGKFQ
jgi:hypothetical protein